MTRGILPLLWASIVVLSSCAQPQMNTPSVSQEELVREQVYQQQYASEDKLRRQEKRVEKRLGMEERLNRVFAPIARSGAAICARLYAGAQQPVECVFEAKLADPQDENANADDVRGVNAHADGERIIVNPAMMQFASDDQELAFVLSHELAHNILRHVDAAKQNIVLGSVVGAALDALVSSRGYSTGGAFGDIGGQVGQLAYSPAFEAEADYMGMYIMAGAKYDYAAAPNFWRRMSARNPEAIYLRTTHPTNPERFVAMQKTAEEIASKQRHKLALIPQVRKE